MEIKFLRPHDAASPRRELFLHAMARALALFFGGFSLLNLLGNFRRPGFDANLSWIDLRAIPEIVATPLLLAGAVCLIAFSWRPPQVQWRRSLTTGILLLLAAASVWNVIEFYALVAQGRLRILLPIPFSLFIFAALLLILFVNVGARPPGVPAKMSLGVMSAFLVCLLAFPMAQMIFFGKADYRRPADVAVVFGARAYKDGRPSDALADRVATACRLYRDGMVKKLIFSGGPGDGPVHETEAMRRLAIHLGVNPQDILADTGGLNTQATVKNTLPMFAQLGAHRILVVSHFYHLPRIKMAYQRAGWEVYTVPAKESYFLRQTPFFVAREVAASWVYYLRPLI